MHKNKNLYNEHSIITEDPRTYTRRVPSVYLGSQQYNSNLIKEVFANAVDEHAIGHGNVITVEIDTEKNIYSVEDEGQGFLVNAGIDKDGETILQRSFDKLNTSGKTSADGVYEGTALGLNGIGAKLTNWLSKKLHVITYRDGEFEEIWFKDGIFNKRNVGKKEHHSGTKVTWSPDPQFFNENKPDINALMSHFEIIAALCPELTIKLKYNGKHTEYKEPNGISGYIDKKVSNKELFTNRFICDRAIGKDRLNICLTYTSDYSENIDAYVNLGHTDSGQHITIFRTAFVRAVNKYAVDAGLLKKSDKNLTAAEISEGLYVVCNITTTTAKYDAQNKSRIDDIDGKIINAVIGGDFATWLINNPNDAKIIIERAITARKAREAAQKAKEKIREAGNTNKKSIFVDLPSKLSDAYPKNKRDRSQCELYICLTGDTKIKLLNGTNPTIESLVGQQNLWAYSTNERGSMIPAQIKKVFKTQETNTLIKISFNDGSSIECTPEHKFLDRDSCTWVMAKDLVKDQSLFSMKFKYGKDGRESVFISNGKDYTINQGTLGKYYHGLWEPTHVRVARLLGIAKEYDGITLMNIHHNDFNKCNNDPSNLSYITAKEHMSIHNRYNHDIGLMAYENKHFSDESRKRMQTAVYRRSADGIDRQRTAVSQAWKDGKYINATFAKFNTSAKRRLPNGKDYTQAMKYCKYGKSLLDQDIDINETNWELYRPKKSGGYSLAKWKTVLSYFDNNVEYFIDCCKNYNLKVNNIEYVYYDKPIPVYCLDIDNPFHSFVLENGIITHNCEGDSAVSSINAVKDSTFQATFPIRGKILNCQKATPEKVYANSEVANITKTLGLDIDKVTGKLIYDPKKLRYNKIIIASDEDVDGFAIASLLITVFNWLCPELIHNGHLYHVHGALFKATFNDKTYKLFYTDYEYQAWKKTNTRNYTLSRAKGLGELTSDETHEQLVDPETRNLHQLVVEDVAEFEKYLEMFQGTEVDPRRDYLEEHFTDYME